jgi:hypothetical protein
VDGDFAERPWDGEGGFEATGGPTADGPMTWTIDTPGVYTLRFTHAKAGAAIDSFVFQLANLPEPTGDGPSVSSLGRAGKIVVANDEWTLSDFAFAVAPDTYAFARNVASYFTAGVPGNFLVFSSNFGLLGAVVESVVQASGHTWTIHTGGDLSLAELQQYDAVFLAGTPADNSVLIAYVQSGGDVYMAGGTGFGGSAAEAAQWAGFLNAFGLSFVGESYNSIEGVVPIASSHPIFLNVSGLYENGGSSVVQLDASDDRTSRDAGRRCRGCWRRRKRFEVLPHARAECFHHVRPFLSGPPRQHHRIPFAELRDPRRLLDSPWARTVRPLTRI